MARIYARWIKAGLKLINDVPDLWKEEVKKLLEKE